MKKIIYLYILESMAEWEVTNILQAISMESMLKKGKSDFEVKTISVNKKPIRTIGGLTIIPDYTLEEINEDNMVALLLPGAENWANEENREILNKALMYLEKGILVAAICGATLELANLKVLDSLYHTSNSLEYLNFFSPKYTGKEFYIHKSAVSYKNLITGSSAGGLLWAKYILEYLNVYPVETIEAWYSYYYTGEPKYYTKLINSDIID